jgi:hypothetical protein
MSSPEITVLNPKEPIMGGFQVGVELSAGLCLRHKPVSVKIQSYKLQQPFCGFTRLADGSVCGCSDELARLLVSSPGCICPAPTDGQRFPLASFHPLPSFEQ